MRGSSTVPGALGKRLDASLKRHLPPASSRVPSLYRETTICYAYMCVYAYGCGEKTSRPAQVLMRRCMRYMPEPLRVQPGMSDLALDILARQRQAGEALSAATTSILDQFRPDGPVRARA